MCIICIDEVNTIDSSIVKDAVEVSRLVGKNRLSQGNLNLIFISLCLILIYSFVINNE